MAKYLTIIKIKKAIFLFFILIGYNIYAQDVGVVDISAPVTGCVLTTAQNITATVYNFGANITTTIGVSYVINGSAPVTENIPPLASLTTNNFTFATKANLSISGSYTITAYTSYPGDTSPANDSWTINIVNYPLSVGGIVAANITVCSGINTGTLTLSGYTGSILNWELSTNGGSSWNTVANTLSTQNYSNIATNTAYRAVVKSGVCPAVNSASVTVTTNSVSVGGTVIANTTVCSGINTGTLTLSGYTGNVLNWESSTNSGGSWTPIVNTTANQNYTNLAATSWYRAQVQSGVCSAVASSVAVETVSPPSVGGIVSSNTTVCSGINTGTLTLSGYTGNILNWEFSTNNGSTWIPIVNNTTNQNYTNIATTTWYRVQVQSGVCSSAASSIAIITIDPSVPIGGSISPNATVCSGSNSGTLTLSGYTVSIFSWESSTNNGTSWTPIANTTPGQNYTNLSGTTWYRAQVQNGVCASVPSSVAVITVIPTSVGGSISVNATVCSGSNNGILTLTGNIGNVLSWESSTNDGSSWTTISNTTLGQSYNNLISTTWYRAKVQSGVCTFTVSSAAIITVSPLSVGGTVSANTTVCIGSNNGTLLLTGYTGDVLNWESSINNGNSWNSISNTATSQNYSDLLIVTSYRAKVKSGMCPLDSSSSAVISFFSHTVDAGIDATVVYGSSVNLNGQGGISYSWSPSAIVNDPALPNPLANPTSTITYTLSVIDLNGCSDADYVKITVTPGEFNYLISNLVTLNGDGINDVWYIQNIEQYPNSAVSIYNKNGQEIFSAAPYLNNWDGTYKGKKVTDGTYFYVLKFTDSEKVYKGSIGIVSEKK
jgi:gliding motility-associated-like protein